MSFVSIMKSLDKNKDGSVSFSEGKEVLGVSGRKLNGIMGHQEDISFNIDALWERWVKSKGEFYIYAILIVYVIYTSLVYPASLWNKLNISYSFEKYINM